MSFKKYAFTVVANISSFTLLMSSAHSTTTSDQIIGNPIRLLVPLLLMQGIRRQLLQI